MPITIKGKFPEIRKGIYPNNVAERFLSKISFDDESG